MVELGVVQVRSAANVHVRQGFRGGPLLQRGLPDVARPDVALPGIALPRHRGGAVRHGQRPADPIATCTIADTTGRNWVEHVITNEVLARAEHDGPSSALLDGN